MSSSKRKLSDQCASNEPSPPATNTSANKRQKLADEKCSLFDNCKTFIVLAGIGKARCDLFKRQILNMGGSVLEEFDSDATHVIVDEKMEPERLCRILNITQSSLIDKDIKVVKSLWLSGCIRAKELLDTADYEFPLQCRSKSDICADLGVKKLEVKPEAAASSSASAAQSASSSRASTQLVVNREVMDVVNGSSDYSTSDDEGTKGDDQNANVVSTATIKLPKGSWICAQSSAMQKTNYNKNITDKLQEMAKTYENLNDRWRVLGYQKAIMALKRHPKPITSFEEAKGLFGVGARLAEKIWEIAESGELRKLNELSAQEDNQSINLFANIWGAGVQTARAWVQQGFRTLDDLREKGNLTKNQQIGLKYYDDLLDRMPRSEAAKIEVTVRETALSIQPGLVAMACGSYRRGKETCGDVDVLITHPDGKSHEGVYKELIRRLHETEFLTDDLVSVEDGELKKYLGVCKLPGEHTKHRRLDIIVVPHSEFACSLLYFTGSAHFNRSMRLLASRRNMSLNEHALCTGVVRNSKREKINRGTPLATPTEQSIFEHFGLPYRPPEERDH